MAVFPRVVAMLARPSQIWSLGKTVTANAPVLSSLYPLSRLTDGSMDQPARVPYGTVQFTVDLGATRTPNLVGLLNHNIDHGRVIGVMNEAGLLRGFGARDPNCWLDLRGFPTTARYWTFAINSNSTPVSLSEIVIATADLFEDGLFEGEFIEELEYPQQRELAEYNQQYISISGGLLRKSSASLKVNATDQAKIDAVFAEVGVSGGRVLMVPSSRVNDIWYLDWPAESPYTYPNQTERKLPLTLQEQVGAVLNGR